MQLNETAPMTGSTQPVRSLSVTVVAGADRGKRHTSAERLTIGLAKDNDLCLSDETVSRYHLELSRQGGDIVARDLGSTNGTRAGGIFLDSGRVLPGTVLQLGNSSVEIRDGESMDLELFEHSSLGGLKGTSATMRALMARVRRIAVSESSALILGETGTGKELVAREIHALSARKDQPLEAVDCGTLLPTLVASELFGHERGAFTGAESRYVGAFERADGGTLFLDEIGELPLPVQAALLGVLERRSFRRLGGDQPISVDVRLVCATNRDLRAEVNAGTFRADLYFRLAVVLLQIPPLRQHTEDLPVLVEHFLRANGYRGAIEEVLPAKVMAELARHYWPGNVRELRNLVEAALVMGELPAVERVDADGNAVGVSPTAAGALDFGELAELPYAEARQTLLDAFESHYASRILELANGNVSEAARRARMHRSYLNKILRRHPVERQTKARPVSPG